jgi:hypothetical protein
MRQRLLEEACRVRGVASVAKHVAKEVGPSHVRSIKLLRVPQADLGGVVILRGHEQLSHLAERGREF